MEKSLNMRAWLKVNHSELADIGIGNYLNNENIEQYLCLPTVLVFRDDILSLNNVFVCCSMLKIHISSIIKGTK